LIITGHGITTASSSGRPAAANLQVSAPQSANSMIVIKSGLASDVTVQGGHLSSMVHKIRHDQIDSSMIESVKADMLPGTSVLVLLSSDAAVGALAEAVGGLAWS
jgi:hypothetical protein